MKLAAELEGIWRQAAGEGRKREDCGKRIREKESERVLKPLMVISNHLRLKNISSAISKTTHPRACARSFSFTLKHTQGRMLSLDAWLLSLCHQTFSLCLCLSVFPSLSLHGWCEIRPEMWRDYSSTLQFITSKPRSAAGASGEELSKHSTLRRPSPLDSLLLFPLW